MLLVLAVLEIEPWSAESATPVTRRHAPPLAGVLRRRHPPRAPTEPAPSRQLLPCAWSRATKPSRRPPAEPSRRPPLDRDPTDPIHQNQARSELSLVFLQKSPSVLQKSTRRPY